MARSMNSMTVLFLHLRMKLLHLRNQIAQLHRIAFRDV